MIDQQASSSNTGSSASPTSDPVVDAFQKIPGLLDVYVRRHKVSDKERCVAYVVRDDTDRRRYATLRLSQLRSQVNDLLGKAAADHYVALDAIPRHADGTVNEAGLPAPAYRETESELGSAERQLQNPELCRVWSQVLGEGRLRPDEDFGLLGGDVLQMMSARAKSHELGIYYTHYDLNYYETLRTLDRRVGRTVFARARSLTADVWATLRYTARRIADRVLENRRRRITSELERPHLDAFREFYRQLPDRHNIFYMHFRSGWLHWLVKNLEFVSGINLILVGTGLTPAEEQWVRRHVPLPFHCIPIKLDTDAVWEMLFDINERNFGRIDVSCFVLNKELFDEMSNIAEDIAINSIGNGSERHCQFFLTYFAFINTRALSKVRSEGSSVSPATYTTRPQRRREHACAWQRLATPDFCRLLLDKLCDLDGEAKRFFSSWRGRLMRHQLSQFIFLSLHTYAAFAAAHGFGVRRIRHLSGPTRLNYGNVLSSEVIASPEIFYTLRYGRDRSDYPLALQADYLLLKASCEKLPEEYATRMQEVQREMLRLKLDPSSASHTVREYLRSRGAGPQALDRPEMTWLQG